MNPLPPDPYIALGVEKDADISAIKSTYRKLVLKCHPDKVQDPALKAIKQDEFQRVQQAYEILSDENKRREYDDEVKLKKLREEVMKNMPHHSASRPPPKNYYEFNVRTAEPPPSFRPGPPPRSPYATGSPHFTSSWDRDIPTRSKHIYEEDVERKARRTASYEKPPRKEEETKEERRRRKEAEEELQRDKERRRADREKEKEREKKKESERRDREREARKAEERELRKAEEREARRAADEREARKAEERRIKKEQDKLREKERDRQRRQEQDEKLRQKKAPFIEHHDSSEEDVHRVHKKKSSSSTKKYSDSPRRDKSSRREPSPAVAESSTVEKTHSAMTFAAEYMHQARRKGSKSGPSGGGGYGDAYSPTPNFPNPEEAWHGDPAAPRSRRGSHEDKKFQVTVEEEDGEPEVIEISAAEGGRPPRLQKSFTSPLEGMHMANSAVPRTPKLARAATMEYTRATPPQAPAAPSPEARHSSSRSDRRRRGSADAYDEEPRPRRSGHHRYEDGTRVLQPEYRPVEEVYSYGSSRGASFRKVKIAPEYSNVMQAQGYDEYKVSYTDVPYSSSPHGTYQYPQYVSG